MVFDLDNAADGELGQRAIEAVQFYLEQLTHGEIDNGDSPVKRAQISGLLQIARNEPDKIVFFAERQREKIQARLETRSRQDPALEAQIDFWKLVHQLCTGRGSFRNFTWSLATEREKAMAEALPRTEQNAGGTGSEQPVAGKRVREEQERWKRQWDQQHYPIFFQRFCSHYLYEMAKRVFSKQQYAREEER